MSFVKSIWGQLNKKMVYYSQKILFLLILAFLFVLPWQTRYIFSPAFINNQPWEYGTKSLYGTEILAWLIILFFILSNVGNIKEFFFRKKTLRSYIAVLLCSCFVLGLFVVAYLGSNPSISFYYIYRVVLGMIVCSILIQVKNASFASDEVERDGGQSRIMLFVFWLSGVVQGILATVQFFTQQVSSNKWLGLAEQSGSTLGAAVIELSSGRWLRAYGAFGWPNSLGIYLAITWIIGLIVYISYNDLLKNSSMKAVLTGGQLLILSGLILSFSRSAWAAALIGSACLGTVSFFRYRKEIKSLIFQALYSLSVVIFFFIIAHPLFTTRFSVENRLERRSVNERVGQWREAKRVFLAHPLQGVGPGAATWYFHTIHPDFNMWEIQPTHNIYLLGLIETGVVMFILFGVLYSWFLKNIFTYNPLYISVIITMFLTGLLDHWLWSLYGGVMTWWVVWGLGMIKYSDK